MTGIALEDKPATRWAGEITLLDLFLILVRRRRLLGTIIGAGLLLGTLVAFLSPVRYRARTSIIPSVALAPPMELGNVSEFRAAASQFGINLGSTSTNPSVLFPEFLAARGPLERVLARAYETRGGQSVNLVEALDLDALSPEATRERAARFFRRALRSSYDFKTGITSISLTLKDPVLAANVLNAYVEEMDAFVRTLRSGRAGQKVEFIAQRLEGIGNQLAEAESRLTEFRQRNRQIAGAPQLQLEEGRLFRDVRVNEEMFLALKTQLELARIEELRSLPDVIVIEKAYPPVRRESPRRSRILVFFTLGASLVGLIAVFGLELMQARFPRWKPGLPGTGS